MNGIFNLFSLRPTCLYLFSEDNAKVIVDMVNKGVDYIVVDQLGFSTTPKFLIPAIFQNPDFFEVVLRLRNPDTFLFRIKSDYDPDKKSDVAGAVLLVMALRRYQMKEFAEAERLINFAMKITRESIGTQSKVYANAVNDLGVIAVVKKEYRKARDYFEQSMAIEKKLLGEEHPQIAMSLINIAEMYKANKEFETAEGMYNQALGIREKVYGPHHASIIEVMYILFKFYLTWGKQERSDEMFNRVVSILDKVQQEDISQVLPILDSFKMFYTQLGREDRVELLTQRISDIRAGTGSD